MDCLYLKRIKFIQFFVGLGPKFEPTVAILASRSDSYNVKAASALLLASKSRAIRQAILDDPLMAANLPVPQSLGTPTIAVAPILIEVAVELMDKVTLEVVAREEA